MKKFRITVDGHEYMVEVEALGEEAVETPTVAAPAKPPASQPKAHAAKPATAPASSGSGAVSAPMPGTVLKILVAEGEQVEAGQALFLLEAMKMENKIPAPKGGVVQEIHVSQGQNVDTGQQLLTLR